MEQQPLLNQTPDEHLYDAQAMQRIMTLAAEIQHKRADLLTGTELERLGRIWDWTSRPFGKRWLFMSRRRCSNSL